MVNYISRWNDTESSLHSLNTVQYLPRGLGSNSLKVICSFTGFCLPSILDIAIKIMLAKQEKTKCFLSMLFAFKVQSFLLFCSCIAKNQTQVYWLSKWYNKAKFFIDLEIHFGFSFTIGFFFFDYLCHRSVLIRYKYQL